MTPSNETLKRIINGYDPKRADSLCKIDVIRLSQMEVLRNPVLERAPVYETFFEYATELVKNHPDAGLDKLLEKMFKDSLPKMAELAPTAFENFSKAKQVKTNNVAYLNFSSMKQHVAGA